MRSSKLHPLEFHVFRQLLGLSPALFASPFGQGKWSSVKILVACSGGLDSVALAVCLARLSSRLGFQVVIGYVHHGPASSPEIVDARLVAFRRCRDLARDLKIPFMAAKPSGEGIELKSEGALREHRLNSLAWIREKTQSTHIAFAHHRQDLFETRLIRLLRGTGPQGLRAMQVLSGENLRPFLDVDRGEIHKYAVDQKLSWLEDPTNSDPHYLRNWLRLVWLPELELKRPGASRAFARSLETLSQNLILPQSGDPMTSGPSFDRRRYMELSKIEKRQAVAAFLLAQGAHEFSSRQIDEILKRLETARHRFSFRLLKWDWEVNAEQVSVKRPSTRPPRRHAT